MPRPTTDVAIKTPYSMVAESPNPDSPLFSDPHDPPPPPLRQIVVTLAPDGLYKIAVMTETATVHSEKWSLAAHAVDAVDCWIRRLR